jgi:hypothetical protein
MALKLPRVTGLHWSSLVFASVIIQPNVAVDGLAVERWIRSSRWIKAGLSHSTRPPSGGVTPLDGLKNGGAVD